MLCGSCAVCAFRADVAMPPPPPRRSNAVEKKTVLENLDLVLLAMDEIVDGGCVGTSSRVCVCGRVGKLAPPGGLGQAHTVCGCLA